MPIHQNRFSIASVMVAKAHLSLDVTCFARLFIKKDRAVQHIQYSCKAENIPVAIYSKFNYYYLLIPEKIIEEGARINIENLKEKGIEASLYDNWKYYFGIRTLLSYTCTELVELNNKDFEVYRCNNNHPITSPEVKPEDAVLSFDGNLEIFPWSKKSMSITADIDELLGTRQIVFKPVYILPEMLNETYPYK